MWWFYTRDRDAMRLEARYDHQAREYVGILTHADGHEDRRQFRTAKSFRKWLVSLDTRLLGEQWLQNGPPYVRPNDGPETLGRWTERQSRLLRSE